MSKTHGMRKTRIYRIWSMMKNRCMNKKNPAYMTYGGRGISVCERWLKFENFLEDMSETYGEKLTIDRINTNGDYEPENCRWATMQVQNNNRRDNRILIYRGVSKTMTEWSRENGIDARTMWQRLENGWTDEEAISIPLIKNKYHKKRMYEFNGENLSISEWAKKYGVKYHLFYKRLIIFGWTIEDTLMKKVA